MSDKFKVVILDSTNSAEDFSNYKLKDYEVAQIINEEGNCLCVTHGGELVSKHFDNGEPEDNSFYRDYDWVSTALENAYALGYKDGKEEQ